MCSASLICAPQARLPAVSLIGRQRKQPYFKVASASGTRSMGVTLDGAPVGVVTASSSTSPRPTGSELGPINVTLIPGSNSVELVDNQGTAELDVHYLRVVE